MPIRCPEFMPRAFRPAAAIIVTPTTRILATWRAAAQLALFPQQTGNTLVGSAGIAWHRVEIAKSGPNVLWKVDGKLIATVPVADDTVLTGNNIFFGHSDTNATSSTDVNDGALLFTLIDNVRVVPEPTSLVLCCIAGFMALATRGRLGLNRHRDL